MDQEIKHQLEEIHALAKDNHRLLRAVRRHQLFGIVVATIFWLAVLITPFFFYQKYLQPFVSRFQAEPGAATSGTFDFPTSADIQKLINSFKEGQ